MNLTIVRLHALVKQVSRLADAQERLAAVAEARALRDFDYHPPSRVKLTEEERRVDVTYTDEEADLVRELRAAMGRKPQDEADDEVL